MARKVVEPVDQTPNVQILERDVSLLEVDLSMTSYKRFLKLADEFSLIFQTRAVRVYVAPTYYADAKRRNEVKTEEIERDNVFVTITNGEDFAISIAWFGGKFQNAYMAGPRARYSASKKWAVTAALKEMKECLS